MWNAPPEVPEVSPAQTASFAPPAPVGTGLYGVDATGQTWQYVPPVVVPLAAPGGPFLPISGGQLTGPLLLNTAPVAADAGVVAVDTDMLRAYGFVGGGVGSTLASKFSTLAAAQAVYPHAIALTDTLDWAAIQGWINAVDASSANGISILFPPGDVTINRPIVTGAKAVYIRGAGPFQTRILLNSATDLFQHGLTTQVYYATFELHDIGLYCTVSGAGYAINIWQNDASGWFRLTNVRFSSFSADFSWLGYINAVGISNTLLRDVHASGGEFNPPSNQAAGTQVGITVTSPDNNNVAFLFIIDNCYVGAIQHAFLFSITGVPGNSGTLEGFIVKSSGGRTNTGPWFKLLLTASLGFWFPPYYLFDKCNMEGPGSLIDIDAASEFHMSDCLMYVQALQSGVTPTDYIRIGQVRQAWFSDTTLALYAGAQINNVISIGANSQNVDFRDLVFNVSDPSAVLTGGIYSDPSNLNVTSSGNQYLNWPAGVPQETNTGTGNLVVRASSFSVSGAPAFSGSPWSSQGTLLGWNYSAGSGASDIMCSHGGGSGGFNFWNVASMAGATPARIAALDATGNFTAVGNVETANGIIGGFLEVGAAGPTWTAGPAAPSSTQPPGSIYSRTQGGLGTTLYVSAGGGNWNAVAGV